MVFNFNSNYMFDLPNEEDTYFELTVNVTVPSPNDSSKYPFYVSWNSGGTNVIWGDGTSSMVSFTPSISASVYVHNYKQPGTYTIKIPYTTTFYRSVPYYNNWTFYYSQPFCTQYSETGSYTYEDTKYYYYLMYGAYGEDKAADFDDFTLNGKTIPDYVVNNHIVYNPNTGSYKRGNLKTLTIGDRVETISANAFGDNNGLGVALTTLKIACTTPPEIQESANGNNALKNVIGENTIIKVPYGSLSTYKATYPYSDYASQIIGASL